MAMMTYQINDTSTGTNDPAVWITISENTDGTLSFKVTQEGGLIGDLRGLFFDVADESILKTLVVSANSSDIRIGDDNIKDLGDGANMNGLTGSDKGYDVGIEIGTSGMGKDDIQSYSFTLGSTSRPLTLNDFSNVDFGVRLTSVGTVDGVRTDSSKVLEITSQAIDAINDLAQVDENHATSGNVFANDTTGGGTSTVTGWSGGAVGSTVMLTSEGDSIATLKLNADGSYVLNANTPDADKLSAGESIVYNLAYEVKNQTEATSWSTDTANFKVVVNGANDGPVAGDDAASTIENATATTGSVLANDSDIDRLDTISLTGWSGGNLGGTVELDNGAGSSFALNADGSYVLDASAADALSEGETITQSFTYTLSDNHSATDTATISVTVTGANDGPMAQDDAGGSVVEDQVLTGNVTTNDSDIDRLDTHTYALASDWDGPGELTFNADGTWSYDSGNLADLNDGQVRDLSFDYVMTDNHGATSTATVSFNVAGVGGGDSGSDSNGGGGSGGSGENGGGSGGVTGTPQYYGLSQGFWTNPNGLQDWDIAKTTSFETTFGVDRTWDNVAPVNNNSPQLADLTLYEAIAMNAGSHENQLANQAVAALLNSMDENLNYRYSTSEVIDMVKAAYTNDIESTSADDQGMIDLASDLEYWNAHAGANDEGHLYAQSVNALYSIV